MDESEPRARPRDANYTASEKKLVVKLVQGRKDILLSTKTDAVTNRQKEKEWAEISSVLNATLGTKRTIQSIRNFWDNTRRKYRRALPDHLQGVSNSELLELIAADPEINRPSIYQAAEDDLDSFSDAEEKPVRLNFISVPDSSPDKEITPAKKPYVMFIDNTKGIEAIQIQDIQSSNGNLNGDISLFDAGDNSEFFNLSDSSNTVSKRQLKAIGTRLLKAKKPRVDVRDVAVCTEECSEERRREELHSLALREKEIHIQILEVELMRKQMELKRDFPDQHGIES